VGAAWDIAAKDLKLRVRDRSVFIFGVVAPLALAFILNLVFGAAFGDIGSPIEIRYGIVQLDEGDVGSAFHDVLASVEDEGFFTLTVYDDREAAVAAINAEEISAAFVIPVGVTADVAAGRGAEMEVIGSVNAATASQIARSVAERFAQGVDTATLAVLTALEAGVSPAEVGRLSGAAAEMSQPVRLAPATAVVRQLDGTTYLVAGFAMFFMFFVCGFGITSLLEEFNAGTMARLQAAPIPRWSVIVGKAITSFLVAIVAMAILIVVSSLLIGANWGNPIAVALLVIAGVLAGVGIMSLAGSFASTAEQAGNIQAIVAVSLAMIGGVFFPISEGFGLLSRLTLISPHAWFLRGLGDLSGGGGVAVVLPATLALLAFAVVTGAIAGLLSRRAIA